MAGILIKPQIKDRVETLTIASSSWITITNGYSQQINFSTATTLRTKVNVSCDTDNYIVLSNAKVKSLYVINNNGVFTLYSIGSKPNVDIVLQFSLIETVED